VRDTSGFRFKLPPSFAPGPPKLIKRKIRLILPRLARSSLALARIAGITRTGNAPKFRLNHLAPTRRRADNAPLVWARVKIARGENSARLFLTYGGQEGFFCRFFAGKHSDLFRAEIDRERDLPRFSRFYRLGVDQARQRGARVRARGIIRRIDERVESP